jgi:hypothetical protein
MRGNEQSQDMVSSYVSLEQRVPCDHPLRAIRKMVDQRLRELSLHFDALYANTGRPSIARKSCCERYCYRRCMGSAVNDC